MNELFEAPKKKKEVNPNAPLAERIRPHTLDDVVGQEHLVGDEGPLRQFFESGDFPSMIFWGPPGVGKTTFAYLIAENANYDFIRISAVESGVKEVREIIAKAKKNQLRNQKTLLFIDEIHRFNKSQQDALLHAVEKGVIVLIGATTENPSFEVNSALLSRCHVYRLHLLSDENIKSVIEFALKSDPKLKEYEVEIEDWDFLLTISSGDARTALNAIEIAVKLLSNRSSGVLKINRKILEKSLQRRTAHYDKKGESHFDTISAFIKSLRGSDPDASLYWLSKMLDAGEDPKFIARRLVIFASEDIGNAEPYAVTLAVSVFKAVEVIGLPEAAINLAQGVTYLASCPKSNSSYFGLRQAQAEVSKGGAKTVPLHLRNAPTKLMKEEGYAENYKYPHGYEDHFIKDHYFPDGMKPIAFYKPSNMGREAKLKARLEKFWPGRYEI